MGKRFRMRKKPVEPERMNIIGTFPIEDGDTLAAVSTKALKVAEEYNIDLSKMVIKLGLKDEPFASDAYGYDGCVKWVRPESDEEYAVRYAEYKMKLEKYNTWYEENREIIERRLEKKRMEKMAKENKRKEREMRTLSKRKQYLEKEIGKIEERLE